MQFAPKPQIVSAIQVTVDVVDNQTLWPSWLHDLVTAGQLKFSTDPKDAVLARLDTVGGEWDLGLDDWLMRFPDGTVTPYPPDLMSLVFQAASVPASAPAAIPVPVLARPPAPEPIQAPPPAAAATSAATPIPAHLMTLAEARAAAAMQQGPAHPVFVTTDTGPGPPASLTGTKDSS